MFSSSVFCWLAFFPISETFKLGAQLNTRDSQPEVHTGSFNSVEIKREHYFHVSLGFALEIYELRTLTDYNSRILLAEKRVTLED